MPDRGLGQGRGGLTSVDWERRDVKAVGGKKDGGSFPKHGGRPDGGHRNDQAIFIVEGELIAVGRRFDG